MDYEEIAEHLCKVAEEFMSRPDYFRAGMCFAIASGACRCFATDDQSEEYEDKALSCLRELCDGKGTVGEAAMLAKNLSRPFLWTSERKYNRNKTEVE